MINYNPSKDEFLIISKCLSLGFKCYPRAIAPGNRPLVVLEVDYNGKPIPSRQPPFDQKYLSYKTFKVYEQFYNKIKDKI